MKISKINKQIFVSAFLIVFVLNGAMRHCSTTKPVIERKDIGTFTPMPKASPYIEVVLKQSSINNLDPAIVLAVIKNESNFKADSISNKGATGLMQVMPSTATWLLKREVTSEELKNPELNIEVGTKYLAFIQERTNQYGIKQVPLIFAGYNAGHSYAMRGVVPNFKETKDFVSRCIITMDELI